ncbi:hypothetical protein KPH14_012042 [Odynerus spinipes]|uniref:Uncharacterized protein n=1 Tax=Odynerus spinipes TaxID=1348599 RepID=A0AAD9VU17_9HYME|nr:hypothetical protein KPH14_012042 [Odynerus spinipes]
MEFELDGSLKEWAKDKPLSILQLDPADRAVLRIAAIDRVDAESPGNPQFLGNFIFEKSSNLDEKLIVVFFRSSMSK